MTNRPGNEANKGLERTRHQLRASGIPVETPNLLRTGVHNRGYLPHVKREGAAYFVTFRLADALPKAALIKLESEHAERLRRTAVNASLSARELRRQIERCLNVGHGACHLRKPEIASLVAAALRHFDGERYLLDDWVIMLNHVHAIVWPMPNHLLGDILKSWKQFSSRRAKALLGLDREPFWQRESYDHWIRDDAEKSRIRGYVRRNPVAAGLCAHPEDWPWGSAAGEQAESKSTD